MNINLDDPDLTAFALGELSGAEREAMATAVAASPEAQARVEEIQALAGLLRGEFRLDLQHAGEKRRSFLALLEQGTFWSDWRSVSVAAAALLVVGALVAAVVISDRGTYSPVTKNERKAAREDMRVEMEVDAPEAELVASNAAQSAARVPADLNAPAVKQRAGENVFAPAAANPRSTFPVQVDTAAYAKVRSSIRAGSRPPKEAVQIEQMINYFSYDYPQPDGDRPFSVTVDAATCPWEPGNQLVRVGLKGREIPNENRSASNLVFLLDVSRSMHTADRLPLLRSAMRLLIDRLTENDRVAIVVYAGASGVALPSTRGDRKEEILRALEELKAGPLAGGIEGIDLAYRLAAENFIAGGVNRVIVATDGELNVGVATQRELVQVGKKNARSGVSLTMLRVGDEPERSAAMQKVATKVGGNYAHVVSLQTARQALLQQINGTLVTIAKDVDIEVVFNPARVSSYRLIGYENGVLRNGDSSAGEEIAAGHTVTALYEIVPANPQGVTASTTTAGNAMQNQNANAMPPASSSGTGTGPLVSVKLRQKQPDGSVGVVAEHSLDAGVVDWTQAPPDFRFAAAVAQFGMILRDSPHKGNGTLAGVLETAEEAKGADPSGYRAGFVDLVRQAQALAF